MTREYHLQRLTQAQDTVGLSLHLLLLNIHHVQKCSFVGRQYCLS